LGHWWRWMLWLGLSGCGWWPWGEAEEVAIEPPPPSHVVFVVVDTLRADHLGVHGDDRGLTPNMDALAQDGVRFAWARAAASTTLASVTTMLTGRYPHTHGVPHNGVRWPRSLVGLQEAYAAAGYDTAGFVSSTPLYEEMGISRGFDHWNQPESRHHRRSDGTLEAVVDWLDGREETDDDRFFAFVHLFDPHYPYTPPPPYDTRWVQEPYEGWFKGTSGHVRRLGQQMRRRGGDPNAASRHAEALYAGEVAHVDAQIGAFLDHLASEDLLDDTLVVLTADHGETFTEHGPGYFDHGFTVHDTEVHVPLIVAGPGVPEGRVVQEPVSLVDLAPTLAEWSGLTVDEGYEGVSLLQAWRTGSQDDLDLRPHFAEATKPHLKDRIWANRRADRAVVFRGDKLYHRPRRQPRWSYYAPLDDPLEQDDRFEQVATAGVTTDLQTRREAWSEMGPTEAGEETIDPDVLEGLEALGYLD